MTHRTSIQIRILSLVFVFTTIIAATATAQNARFAVIADPHFYDTDLGTTGQAFEAYLAQDRKMLRESEAILIRALEGIRAQRPDFVIIPGDLTKDGEMISHIKLANYLAGLEADGIEVFVVPGNHDINNPHAVAFEGEQTVPVEQVTPALFADIYGPFGYHQAIARDPGSLTYVAEPVAGMWLFGIDSCRYDDNVANGYPETGGALSAETLDWILDKLAEARLRHKSVMGFMHHGLLEHYTGQSQLFADYVIADWQTVSETLAQAGLQLLFSGHYHANDITLKQWEDNHLYDVQTGSLVTYPSPYRIVGLHGRNAAVVRTFHVEDIDFDTNGMTFAEYARTFLLQGLTGIAAYQLTLPPEQGGFSLSEQEAQEAAPSVAQAFMAHYAGDETPDASILSQIQAYLGCADPRYQQLGQAMGALWTDLPPADGSAVLSLKPSISLTPVGTYATGIFDGGAAEIAAYDAAGRILFVVNGENKAIDRLDISDPADPVLLNAIDVTPYGGSPTSVAVHDGLVAVAVPADIVQNSGKVVVFDTTGKYLAAYDVGALPDMVCFTPDGRYILSANEGEPNGDYSVDPEGSVSIIDLKNGIERAQVNTADFRRFNDDKAELISRGVRIFGPGASVAQDLEPEFITVQPHSAYAWVALQENNAIAKIHIRTARVAAIFPCGTKDHGMSGNGFDPGDMDGAIAIRPYENVMGMIQPDAIASYQVKGRTYLVTANEGDGRDYDTFSEEALVGELTLDPIAFPDAAEIQDDRLLGRLTVTNTLGDTDGDGDFDRLYSFGGRSFSIFSSIGNDLVPVFDSGDQFEQITAAALPSGFNSDSDANGTFDSRSSAKGPEPEGVAIGAIGCRTYAFICLERVGGIMVYDITCPLKPQFVAYVNNRNFNGDAAAGTAGDLGPEGLVFISAEDSPSGLPMLAVANEVSGTTTLYQIDVAGCARMVARR